MLWDLMWMFNYDDGSMQRMKTRVIRKDVNPEWNEDLTLSVTDPNEPVIVVSP